MNKKMFFLIFVGMTCLIFGIKPIEAAINNISQIQGNTGVITANSSGIASIVGSNRITTLGSNQTLVISENQFVYISPIEQVRWNTGYHTSYFTPTMNFFANDINSVSIEQSYSGTINKVSLHVVTNKLSSPVRITLYDNGISTGLTGQIQPNTLKSKVFPINFAFQQGDILTWQFQTTDSGNKDLILNFQAIITYNG